MPKVSEAHLEARRGQILKAACRCFARGGIGETSIQDICHEAKLSVGAIYRYFRSKGQIIEAIAIDNGYACVDVAACMGCGVCVSHCPEEAISLLRNPAKGEPLEIQQFVAHATQVPER